MLLNESFCKISHTTSARECTFLSLLSAPPHNLCQSITTKTPRILCEMDGPEDSQTSCLREPPSILSKFRIVHCTSSFGANRLSGRTRDDLCATTQAMVTNPDCSPSHPCSSTCLASKNQRSRMVTIARSGCIMIARSEFIFIAVTHTLLHVHAHARKYTHARKHEADRQIYLNTLTYARISIYTHSRTHARTQSDKHSQAHTSTHTCIFIHAYTHMYVGTQKCAGIENMSLSTIT